MGVFRIDDRLLRQLQRADKSFFQLRKEVQRPAEKGDAAADRLAAGEAGDRLVDDRLKDRRREVRLCGALIDQGLDIRLGENAAPGRNRIDLPVIRRGGVQSGCIRLQQGSHLVDKCACPASADPVHPFFEPAGEIYDLRVLAAKLDGDVRLRRAFL